jgi:hypothetical protein
VSQTYLRGYISATDVPEDMALVPNYSDLILKFLLDISPLTDDRRAKSRAFAVFAQYCTANGILHI